MNRRRVFKKLVPVLALMLPLIARAADPLGLDSVKQLFCGAGLACSTSLSGLILGVIHLLLMTSGSLAVLFVILGGYFYVTAGGNEERAQRGRKTLTNAVVGLIIVIMSYALVAVVQNTVSGNF